MFKGIKKWKENSSPKIVGMIANIMHLTMMVLVLIVSMDGEGVFGKKESFVMIALYLIKISKPFKFIRACIRDTIF